MSRKGVNNARCITARNDRSGNGALNRVGMVCREPTKTLAGLKRILAGLKMSSGLPQSDPQGVMPKKSGLKLANGGC